VLCNIILFTLQHTTLQRRRHAYKVGMATRDRSAAEATAEVTAQRGFQEGVPTPQLTSGESIGAGPAASDFSWILLAISSGVELICR